MKILKLIFLAVLTLSCEPKDDIEETEDLLVNDVIVTEAKINGGNVLSTFKLTGNANTFDMSLQTNANWVSLAPIIEIRENSDNILFFDSKKAANVPQIINNIKDKGIDFVMLKPQISFQNLGFDFWGDYNAASENEWTEVESSFQELLLAYAETSITNPEVKILCIGNELFNFTRLRPEFFRETALLIKQKYPNLLLTYAANWDEYEHINFWDTLDYIGINPYFPLVNKSTPTIEEIENAYKPIKIKLSNLSAINNKPLLFTEYGFRSINNAAWKAWELPSFFDSILDYNPQVQTNGYTAFYNTFWNENWVAGGFFWVWEIISQGDIDNGNENTYLNSDWSINYKPVTEVIKNNYSK